jgi:hypothetical protein
MTQREKHGASFMVKLRADNSTGAHSGFNHQIRADNENIYP